jgi:molybdopterin converting factor subunit 1
MHNIKVLFFATLRDRVGARSVEMQIPAQTNVAGLKILLTERFLALKESLGQVLVSVNQEYAFDDALIPNEAEVALFPPVSGG